MASPKRGAVVEELRAEGVAEELLEALETPAGLDIGARTPAEVALSIVARIVEVRRSGSEPDRTGTPVTAVDPICGITVVIAADTPSLEHDGGTVYFSARCRRNFEERSDLARRDG